MPTQQRPSAQKDRNRVSWCLSLISSQSRSLVTHLMSHHYVSQPGPKGWKKEYVKGLPKGSEREFTESMGSETVNHMSLITCHSYYVTHLRSHQYVTNLMSLTSYHDLMTLISYLIITSIISCLIITLLILSYFLFTLGWPHLTSGHDLCPLVTA